MKNAIVLFITLSVLYGCPGFQRGLQNYQVQNVDVVSITNTSVKLSWNYIEGASNYIVVLMDSSERGISDFFPIDTCIVISSLTPNTKYGLHVGASPNKDGPTCRPSKKVWFHTLQ